MKTLQTYIKAERSQVFLARDVQREISDRNDTRKKNEITQNNGDNRKWQSHG